MGMTTRPINFIDIDARINVTETTERDLISKNISIGDFTVGHSSTVEQVLSANSEQDVGMLIVKRDDGKFIVGHQV